MNIRLNSQTGIMFWLYEHGFGAKARDGAGAPRGAHAGGLHTFESVRGNYIDPPFSLKCAET